MITIRKISNHELTTIKSFYGELLETIEIQRGDFIVAFDDKFPLGFAQIILYENITEILTLYVNVDERGQGLGDGILRSALNYAINHGQTWAFYQKDDKLSDFLIKEGFRVLSDKKQLDQIDQYIDFGGTKIQYCNIMEFFQQDCGILKRDEDEKDRN